MSQLAELRHTLEIIQSKLDACHKEQCNKKNKMSTKQMLLQDAHNVLRHMSGCLEQNYRKKRIEPIQSHSNHLEPMIGLSFDNDDTSPTSIKERLQLIRCQGWIRQKRIWIQAQGICLSEDIQQAKLGLLPNKDVPETTIQNTLYNIKAETTHAFYLAFDLPDDADPTDLSIVCIVNGNHMTKTCPIQWINGDHDTSWKEQMLSIFTPNVIQAYFPCHLVLLQHDKNESILNSLPLETLTEKWSLSADQTYLIESTDSGDYHLHGLDHNIVAKIAKLFPWLSSNTLMGNKELIQSLSHVTLDHKARFNTALVLSAMTK